MSYWQATESHIANQRSPFTFKVGYWLATHSPKKPNQRGPLTFSKSGRLANCQMPTTNQTWANVTFIRQVKTGGSRYLSGLFYNTCVYTTRMMVKEPVITQIETCQPLTLAAFLAL